MVRPRDRSLSIREALSRIDKRGYKHYKSLLGLSETVKGVRVAIVKVQGDPYAPPSVVKLECETSLPGWSLEAPVATSDWILRRLWLMLRRLSMRGVGEGNSGVLGVPKPAPIMIRRSSLEVERVENSKARVVARVYAGLPSRGRRVMSGLAEELLLDRLPRALLEALRVDEHSLRRHVRTWIEQEHIRSMLDEMSLVSFIADGSILPRKCGGCWEPLENAVPFESPPSLRVSLDLPTGRSITGMGVKKGLTVIAGPAYHGKTTLVEAISSGVWNHIPGDGREYVITVRESFVVTSENGRSVSCVDLTPWLVSLPGLKSRGLDCFTTRDASGATSVAATIQESIELGAKLLILDEDNVATNIIHRDYWLEKLIDKRTIQTIADLAEGLKRAGVSVVIVATGSRELVSNSDSVVVMSDYRAIDVTGKAALGEEEPNKVSKGSASYSPPKKRMLRGRVDLGKVKLRGRMLEIKGMNQLVDLRPLTQLEEDTQYNTVVRASLKILNEGGVRSISSECKKIESELTKGRFKTIVGHEPDPSLSEVRALDIGFLINRIPGLRVSQG